MISREEIENLANLARLELDESQKASLAKDLENILGYVSELKEAGDLRAAGNGHLAPNVMREDGPALSPEAMTKELVEAAPKHDGRFVKVKKIL